MPVLGHNSELVGSTQKKWCLDGAETRAGCTRSDAGQMQSTRLANGQQASVARSEHVYLLRLGSATLRGCRATGRGQDQKASPLVARVRFPYVCLGHSYELVGSTSDGAEAVPGLALDTRGAML